MPKEWDYLDQAIDEVLRDRMSTEALAVNYREQANQLRDEYYSALNEGNYVAAAGINVARYQMIECAARLERLLRGI